ncbi:hypothetical protein E2562_037266 [Oryza meyeriana var. granulata]|uniref:Uncharacterized protein n=1 Tax=Oryza meyeriana var. granulata TaxID=110450 RepID=A0A6G1EDJ9_9ORYZ|nr:hypothetical protein E2562_037266 [Oryza meyeriana var. granulata]
MPIYFRKNYLHFATPLPPAAQALPTPSLPFPSLPKPHGVPTPSRELPSAHGGGGRSTGRAFAASSSASPLCTVHGRQRVAHDGGGRRKDIPGCYKFMKVGLQNKELLAKMFEDIRNSGADHWSLSQGTIPTATNDAINIDEDNQKDDETEEDEPSTKRKKGCGSKVDKLKKKSGSQKMMSSESGEDGSSDEESDCDMLIM